MSLLYEPGGLTVGPAAASTWPSRSLVEVLPEEPVIAERPQPAGGQPRVHARGQPAERGDRVGDDDARAARRPGGW